MASEGTPELWENMWNPEFPARLGAEQCIYPAGGGLVFATVRGKGTEDTELMVKTHKIRAAPEMLAVLEWIADGSWNDGPGSWAVLDRRVEEVIAKAKGEA